MQCNPCLPHKHQVHQHIPLAALHRRSRKHRAICLDAAVVLGLVVSPLTRFWGEDTKRSPSSYFRNFARPTQASGRLMSLC